MTDSLNGYTVGQRVEARWDEDYEWRPGKLSEIDASDEDLPFFVDWDDGGFGWLRRDRVRALAPQAAAPRWQFKAGNADEWTDLDDGCDGVTLVFPSAYGEAHVMVRKVPAHSAEEIVARLLEIDGREISTNVHKIIRGEF